MSTATITEQRCQVCGRRITSRPSTSRGMGPVCEEHQGFCLSPFTIIVDSNETNPYHFSGIKEDADRGQATIIPQIQQQAMWVDGLADYSIQGHETEIQIERKSKEDLYATLGGRREKFEVEIKRLNDVCRIAYVVIEAEWSDIILRPPQHSNLNPKAISRTFDSWSMKYPGVHWVTCYSRRHAEVKTYRLLEMFWKKMVEE